MSKGDTPTPLSHLRSHDLAGKRVGVVLPLGSVEQHGPHLPIGSDTLVAKAITERVVQVLNASAEDHRAWWVGPEVGVGASGEHQDFPGTLSIGTEALTAVLVEIARSATSQGWRLIVVNGHGGNRDALVGAGAIWRKEGLDAVWVPCVPAPPEPGDTNAPVHDAHAGHTETSLLLHLYPDLVDMALATPGEASPLSQILPALQQKGVRALSPTGVLGDPTTATATWGEKYLEDMVVGVLRRIRTHQPDGTSCLVDPSASDPIRSGSRTSVENTP